MKKNSKLVQLLFAFLSIVLLAACSGDSDTAKVTETADDDADIVADSFDELNACGDKLDGQTAYVKEEKLTYVCDDGHWVVDSTRNDVLDSAEEDRSDSADTADIVVDSFDDLKVCGDKLDGKTAYVKEEKHTYICEDGHWGNDSSDNKTSESVDEKKSDKKEKKGKSSSSLSEAASKSSSSQEKDKADSESSSSQADDEADSGSSSSQDKDDGGRSLLAQINIPRPCKIDIDADCFMDNRDNRTYRIVRIGDQIWMAENLNYNPLSKKCIDDDLDNCEKYGRYYEYSEALGACPNGWHLPDTADWKKLIRAVGGDSVAGTMLKSTSGWVDKGGTDAYGFTALPVGGMASSGVRFIGRYASFWTSEKKQDPLAITNVVGYKYMYYSVDLSSGAERSNIIASYGSDGLSVRCVLNVSSALSCRTGSSENKCKFDSLVDSRDGKTYKTVRIGGQNWMAENLNYETANSFCYGSDQSCAKIGRLYTWADAMDSAGEFSLDGFGCGYGPVCTERNPVHGICPEGWHLPDSLEWNSLIVAVGGKSEAGLKLKSDSGWKDDHNGLDKFGFSAFPTDGQGGFTSFWSSSNTRDVSTIYMNDFRDMIYWNRVDKKRTLSIRCLQDNDEVLKMIADRNHECKINGIDTCEYDSLTDARDGQTYKTVKIGNQWWMAENLNFRYLEPNAKDDSSSFCYGNLPENCEKYGRLYLWSVVSDGGAGKAPSEYRICPEGWHLPDTTEFNTLLTTVGGDMLAARMLKSASDWTPKPANGLDVYYGSDAYSFAALPSGRMSDRKFELIGTHTIFWSSTPYIKDDYYVGAYVLSFDVGGYYTHMSAFKVSNNAYSVRCIKD